MASKRETALNALKAAISAAAPAGASVQRDDGAGDMLPETAALIVVADGSVESESILSPPLHEITLSAEITVQAYQRDAVDQGLLALAAALEADPKLGGSVDGWELGDPASSAVAPIEQQAGEAIALPPYHAAQVSARLFYVAATPLG